jgi:predicted esterase
LSALASTAETCFPDRVNRILIPILSLLWFPAVSAEEGKPAPSPVAVSDLVPGKRATVRFTESPPQSADPLQVRYRLMAAEEPPAYEVSKETFDVLLPAGWDGKSPLGLFLWIDAGDQPRLSEPWEKILAKHQLVYAGARRSGNPRNLFDRLRLAIDANHNLRQRLPIDGRRVYVSGFSGGSRVASMLGVAWGEMFSGTICCMGVNFYTDVAAPDGKVYGLSYLPDEELLPLVKKHCRFALVTGGKDFNRPNTLGAFGNGFQKEGFEHVRVFDIPEHGHSLPPPEWLDQAISFVDEGKREAKPAR